MPLFQNDRHGGLITKSLLLFDVKSLGDWGPAVNEKKTFKSLLSRRLGASPLKIFGAAGSTGLQTHINTHSLSCKAKLMAFRVYRSEDGQKKLPV